MRLSIKIFISISICAIVSILIITSLIIDQNHQMNINRENRRCIQELEIILNTIINNIKYTDDDFEEFEDIIKNYISYYKKDETDFIILKNDQKIYETIENMPINNILLKADSKNYITKIENINEKEYILVCSTLNNEYKIIYIRDITQIYNMKNEMQRYGLILIACSTFILLIISYIISKSITKPLNEIKKRMININDEETNTKLEETNDDFGQLSKAFNNMKQEVKDRNDELLRLVQSKQMFIDNLSHEMNTPLTTIQGYAELLEKIDCTEEQKMKFLQYIQEETKRIKEMYKKLLLISYKKNEDLQIQEEDFEKIVEEIKRQLQQKLLDTKIILVVNNDLKKLNCDKTLIQIAISNLISNAVNVSKEGDRIILNAYENETQNIIEIVDEGCGISEENISKIVEPFYRVDKARSRKLGGAGLGLTMCTNIIKMHNGVLKIESKLGEGSTFRIILEK